jgi:hypothetical protein
MLVDLCERTHDRRLWALAVDLRKQWGMGEQKLDSDGHPFQPDLSYLGINIEWS